MARTSQLLAAAGALVMFLALTSVCHGDTLVSATVANDGTVHYQSNNKLAAKRAALQSRLSGSNERIRLSTDETSILYIPPTGYDSRRPPPDSPTKVKFSAMLTKLYGVNENDGTVRVTMETSMMWTDSRLNYEGYAGILKGGEKFITLESSEVWHPRLDFHGAILETEQHGQARVFPDGTVYYLALTDYLMAVELDLRWFPFDSQDLLLEAYVWDHPESNVKLALDTDWNPWTSTPRNSSFAVCSTMDVEKTHYILESLTGEVVSSSSPASDKVVKWSGVQIKMHTYRKQVYYVLAYFLPLNIITVAASTSFYIAHTDSGSRISVSLSAILALIGMDYVMLAELPRCGYVLWIHFYIIGQFLLVLLPLFFHFIVVHFSFFDPDVGEDAETGDADVVEGKTFEDGAEQQRKRLEGNGFMYYVKKVFGLLQLMLPSGWGVPVVRKVDNCGFMLFMALFVLFNVFMFTLGVLNKLHENVTNQVTVIAQPDP